MKAFEKFFVHGVAGIFGAAIAFFTAGALCRLKVLSNDYCQFPYDAAFISFIGGFAVGWAIAEQFTPGMFRDDDSKNSK